MIILTRLNDRQVVVNAELIKYVEQTPDTLVTLTSGDKLMVKESSEEVVRRVIEFGRTLRVVPRPM
jgi:flagellar protein FlbD